MSAAAAPVSGPASIAVVVIASASHVGSGAPVCRSSVCGTSVGRSRRAPVVGSTMVRGVSGTSVSARTAVRGTSVGTSVGDASVSEASVAGTRVRARTAVCGTGVRTSVGDPCVSEVTVGWAGVGAMVGDACVSEVTVGGTGVGAMVGDTCVSEITVCGAGVRARTAEVWATVSGSGVGASVSDTSVPVGRTSMARPGVSGTRAEIRTAVCWATESRAGVTKATMRHFVGRSRESLTVVRRTCMCCAGSSRERTGGCGSGVAHGRRPVSYTRCAMLRLCGTKDTSGDTS